MSSSKKSSAVRKLAGPVVSEAITSQKVTFSESLKPSFKIWNSESVSMLDSTWSFRFQREDKHVNFRIKFEGPSPTAQLAQIVIMLGEDGGLVEVIRNVRFVKLEARLVRDLCNKAQFNKLLGPDSKLKFTVKLVIPANQPEKKVSVKPEKVGQLQSKVAQLTQERNTLHKSLQKLSVSESEVSFLNNDVATQPEVTRQYEGFKQASKNFAFTLLSEYKPQEYGEILISFVGRLIRRTRQQREEKYNKVLQVLDILNPTRKTEAIAENAIQQLIKSGGGSNLFQATEDELYQIGEIIRTSKLNDLSTEARKEASDFGSFIWALSNYTYGNSTLFVNWDSFGKFVKFERGKHTSISRRARAGEDCFIVIPMLQRKPFGVVRQQNVDDCEALCTALVCPV